MSIRVKREEFLARLQSVQAGLSSKEVTEQSSCFAFMPGEIVTYNEEVSCRTKFEHHKGFKGAVQAKPLLELLAKLPEEDVELEMSDAEMLITGARREAGIRMEKEILLAVSLVEQPEEDSWRPLPAEFEEALKIVLACTGTDDSRFNMTCVHFHARYIEACDNLQAARFKLKLGIDKEFIVRGTSLKQIGPLGMVEVADTDSWVHFRNPTGLVISCRTYKDEFPDMSSVFAPEEAKWSAATLPGGLAEEVEKAQIFSADSNDDKVLVELRPGKIRIKGQGVSGWFRATKKLTYDGPSMEFLVSPKLLIELTKKANVCEIATERLKVTGEKYTYISCLTRPTPERNGDGEEKSDAEEEVAGADA